MPGIIVSGAKVVATNSALTHYNFLAQNMSGEIDHEDFAVMFIAPMDAPGSSCSAARPTSRWPPRPRRPSTTRCPRASTRTMRSSSSTRC